MKLLKIFLLAVLPLFVFGQSNQHQETITSLFGVSGNKQVRKDNFEKFIVGVDQFSTLSKSTNFEFVRENKKSYDAFLVRLDSKNEYELFTVIPKEFLTTENKDTTFTPNAIGFFLLYNKLLDKIICFRPQVSGGGIKNDSDNKITLSYNLNNLYSEIFLIDNNFMPVSSFAIFQDKYDDNTIYSLTSFFDKANNKIKKLTKTSQENSFHAIENRPLSSLIQALERRPLTFDYEQECNDGNCYSEITAIFINR